MSERRRRTMGERGAPRDPIRNIRYGREEPCGDIPAWRQRDPSFTAPSRDRPKAASRKSFWQQLVSILPWVHDDEPVRQTRPAPAPDPESDLEDEGINTRPIFRLVVDFDTGSWQPTGVLSEMGYKVGKQGLGTMARREILRQVLRVELVAGSADAHDYVREWGPPASGQRLTKMCNSIAAFSRNAQRRNADYSEAIADWEEDLDWLAATYG